MTGGKKKHEMFVDLEALVVSVKKKKKKLAQRLKVKRS